MLLLLLGWASGGVTPTTATARVGGAPDLFVRKADIVLTTGTAPERFPGRKPDLFV